MPNFEKIKPQLDEMKGRIKLAEEEMLFVKDTFHSLELRIKPIWAIFIVISLFVMEAIKAVYNKGFKISVWTWVVLGVTVVGYLTFFIIMSINNYKYNKERRELFAVKKSIYESLNAQRRDFFEEFVSETNGEKLLEANLNLVCYLWKEGSTIVIATLKEELEIECLELSEIRYIANDELLSDYNKKLGLSSDIEAATPYCYLFTDKKCYVFLSEGYSVLRKMFPDKEIERAIFSESSEIESEVI